MEICGKEIQIKGRLIRIAQLAGEKYEFLDDPEAALEALRKCGIRIDLFTFIQRLSEVAPKFAFPLEWENFAALRISDFDSWMKNQINNKARNMVRKAEKSGVSLREVALDDSMVRGISAIYNESPVRQGKRFWHYGEDLETVRAINGTFPDHSIYIGAFWNEELIGFVRLVTDETRRQAGLMQIMSMIRHRDKAPTNALVAQAVRSCAARGILHLWYSNFAYGKKQDDGLADFKRHNGFQRMDVPRYYVPLTAWGSFAFRCGLHQKLSKWIPEPVTATYRRIRSYSLNRRFTGSGAAAGVISSSTSSGEPSRQGR